jgi:hypothetical protein
MDSKSKPIRSTNIWTYNIDNEINDPRLTILIINTIIIEHYDLRFDFVIHSHNGSNQKSQFLADRNFTKYHSIMMEELEYYSLFRQLNEEKR